MGSQRDPAVVLLDELEQLCAKAERELVALNWSALDATIADQRRVIAALTNSVYATAGQRSPELNAQIKRRLARIFAGRDHQLKRLITFRDNVRNRLTTIAKVKQVRRSFGASAYAQATRPSQLDALR